MIIMKKKFDFKSSFLQANFKNLYFLIFKINEEIY